MDPANFESLLKTLGEAVKSHMICATGKDDAGQILIETLSALAAVSGSVLAQLHPDYRAMYHHMVDESINQSGAAAAATLRKGTKQ